MKQSLRLRIGHQLLDESLNTAATPAKAPNLCSLLRSPYYAHCMLSNLIFHTVLGQGNIVRQSVSCVMELSHWVPFVPGLSLHLLSSVAYPMGIMVQTRRGLIQACKVLLLAIRSCVT